MFETLERINAEQGHVTTPRGTNDRLQTKEQINAITTSQKDGVKKRYELVHPK